MRVPGTAVLVVPALPILPGCIGAGVGGPAAGVVFPVVVSWGSGCVMVACPAVAPGIIRLAFPSIRQDVVCSNEHAIALEAHVKRQLGYGRGDVAAVGVVELDEGVETVFGICIALAALEDLVRGGCFMGRLGLGPRQQVGIVVLGVATPLVLVLVVVVLMSWSSDVRAGECMTA
jgi:hypothetical protein